MLKIEKGIPIPPTTRRKADAPCFATMRLLAIGESILFAGEDFVERNILSARCAQLKQRWGITTTTRREGAGYRVWRTA